MGKYLQRKLNIPILVGIGVLGPWVAGMLFTSAQAGSLKNQLLDARPKLEGGKM